MPRTIRHLDNELVKQNKGGRRKLRRYKKKNETSKMNMPYFTILSLFRYRVL